MPTSLFSHAFRAMGSPCALHIHAVSEAEMAIACAALEAEVGRIEQKFSRYRDDSVVADINRAASAGETIELDEETSALMDFAFACHAKSAGLFDITSGVLRKAWRFPAAELPDPQAVAALLSRVGLGELDWRRPRLGFGRPGMEIDLGGIGKEYAADRGAAVLRELGVTSALVDLGGDIVALGPGPDGSGWNVALRDPDTGEAGATRIELRSGALATSGDYARCIQIDGRRYSHILDPRTGWPAQGLASASVLADSCMVAGAVATIALLEGERGPIWLESTGRPHLWIGSDGARGGTLPTTYG
jgi:thiamine biosynthesis lipoprotein